MPNPNIITGLVRFSFVHIFEKTNFEDGKPTYSVSLLIPKSDKDTIRKIEKCISQAITDGLTTFNVKDEAAARRIKKFWIPLRDGDEDKEDDEAYAGHYYLTAKAHTRRPGIVDKNLKQIIDPEEVYSGCYGRADISFFPFSTSGSKGIGCSLENIQKVKDGEPLGGVGRKAEEAFNDGFKGAATEEDEEDYMG